jgi:flagellar biosynthesis protein FlhF
LFDEKEFKNRGDWKARTVLTVAANTRERDLKLIVDGFSSLKYDMACITKCDETYALGTIYNVSQYTKTPIAWITTGQRVPEDIELANPEKIAVKVIMEALAQKQP